jgi:uncharacterized protein YqgC (DUF456 family)
MPGLVYMLVVAILFGAVDKLEHLTLIEFIPLLMIVLASTLVDYLSGILGARWSGASKTAVVYGFIASIIGILLLPPFGGVVGLFFGVLVAELSRKRDQNEAIKAATGSVLGTLAGMGVNFLLAIAFILAFVSLAQ